MTNCTAFLAHARVASGTRDEVQRQILSDLAAHKDSIIVFDDETGRVTRVHANAVPGDTTPIDGGNDVRFVLEINGGLAKRLGIVPGAEMRHPSIPQDGAVWPCDG